MKTIVRENGFIGAHGRAKDDRMIDAALTCLANAEQGQIHLMAAKLNQAPFHVDPARPESLGRLWSAYELVEPGKVKGQGGRQLVDVIALVKHAIDPSTLLTPLGVTVEERYREWLGEKSKAGITFTADQIKWLDAIKNHIASSLAIEQARKRVTKAS